MLRPAVVATDGSGSHSPYGVELPGMQGATCSGGLDEEWKHFQPIKGVWNIETTTLQTGGEMLRYRVAECTEGHKLIRGKDSSYTRDQCDACEYGKFALGKAIYNPFHEKRNEQCFDCTEITGLQCKGGLHLHVYLCTHDSSHECAFPDSKHYYDIWVAHRPGHLTRRRILDGSHGTCIQGNTR